MLTLRFPELVSTHLFAKENVRELLAQSGNIALDRENHWGQLRALVLCDEQTGGIGRRGERWLGARGNLFATYLSVSPRPWPPQKWGFVAIALGFSLLDTLQTLMGASASAITLKWPNDLVIAGGKVAGVLVEQLQSGHAFLLSLGVNLCEDASTQRALGHRYACLNQVAPAPNREQLLALLNVQLAKTLQALWQNGSAPFIERLAKGPLQPGTLVAFCVPTDLNQRVTGRFCAIDELGRLCIEVDGTRIFLNAEQLAHLQFV